MGNAESSTGVGVGSTLIGILAAPMTGGASIVVSSVVMAGSLVTAVVQSSNGRVAAPEDRASSFFTGMALGGMTGGIGAAAKLGAEVTIGVGAAIGGTVIGVGATTAGDGKTKPYVGNQELAAEYYRGKDELARRGAGLEREAQLFKEYLAANDVVLDCLTFDIPRHKLDAMPKNLAKKVMVFSQVLSALPVVDLAKTYELLDAEYSELGRRKRYLMFSAIVSGAKAMKAARNFDSEMLTLVYSRHATQIDKEIHKCTGEVLEAIREINELVERRVELRKEMNKIREGAQEAALVLSAYRHRNQPVNMDDFPYWNNIPKKIRVLMNYVNREYHAGPDDLKTLREIENILRKLE